MNYVIWILLGGAIGWSASLIMETNGEQHMIRNPVVGIAGALLGGWLIAPLFEVISSNDGEFSVIGLGVALLCAVLLLAVSRAVTHVRAA